MNFDNPSDPASGVPLGVARVFTEASGYYRNLRWEKNRLTRFERDLTARTLEEELGADGRGAALELGCGPGTWTGMLTARATSVLAVDISSGMLEEARSSSASGGQVEFRQGDISGFDPGSRTFDLILSVRVLEYVPAWRNVVGSFGRWLNPGGRAVVITKTPFSVWRGTGRTRWFGPRTLANRLSRRQANPDFWQRYIPVRGMVGAFKEAGLTDIVVRPVIFGLPIFMRGTKQYPIVPPFAEGPVIRASGAAWNWVSRRPQPERMLFLPLAESYAVSGRRNG
ncbi:MAG TPA: class I SAM-dependent methyltransferase [Candidatus Nitrosotalea sp.]|nr:class I SAM-dependent methyltransferase [Candidatus Nitrosotalea sp.]